jgi:hypothetical protein
MENYIRSSDSTFFFFILERNEKKYLDQKMKKKVGDIQADHDLVRLGESSWDEAGAEPASQPAGGSARPAPIRLPATPSQFKFKRYYIKKKAPTSVQCVSARAHTYTKRPKVF